MSDWLIGFVSGVGATIIGFAFTLLWDIYKQRQAAAMHSKAVYRVIRDDIAKLHMSLDENLNLLRGELEALEEDKFFLKPMATLSNGSWDALRFNLPPSLSTPEVMSIFRYLTRRIDDCNEFIRSRENFKQLPRSNWKDRLATYNKNLISTQLHLKEVLEGLSRALDDSEEKPRFIGRIRVLHVQK